MCNFRLPIFDFGKRRNGRCETLSAKHDLQSEYRRHALTDGFNEAGIAAARNWKRWQGGRSRIAVMAARPHLSGPGTSRSFTTKPRFSNSCRKRGETCPESPTSTFPFLPD